jgi:hypothetical protein
VYYSTQKIKQAFWNGIIFTKGLVMGFRIANRNGRYGMRAFCDHCGVEVVNNKCNVLSLRHFDEGCSEPVVIACKGRCTDAVDPKGKLANDELGRSVLQLAANANIDLAEEMETARIFNAIAEGSL